MDKIQKYFLDAYIISKLFQIEDADKIEQTRIELQQQQVEVINETYKEFFSSKGLSEEEINQILASEDWDNLPPELKTKVQDPELLTTVDEDLQLFIKSYFEKLFPKLSVEDQEEVQKYIELSIKAVEIAEKEKQKVLEAREQILKEHNVSTYEELQAKLNSEIPVSLGGMQSKAELPDVAKSVQEVPQSEVVEPVVTVEAPAPVVTSEAVTAPTEPVVEPVVTAPVVAAPIENVEPVVQVAPVEVTPEVPVAASVDASVEAPQVETTSDEVEEASNPFDWNSLILEQIEGENPSVESPVPAMVEPEAVAQPVEQAPVESIASPIVPESPVVDGSQEATTQNISAAAKMDSLGLADLTSPETPVAPQ